MESPSSQVQAAPLVESMTAFYDRFGPDYDGWAGGLNERVARRLVELAAPKPGEMALDVGTGTGLAAVPVAEAVSPDGIVFAIDLCESMLELARSRRARDNLKFQSMVGERLVFRGETFDLVVFSQSLSYLIFPETALRETFRVLKPGGRIALSVQSRDLSTQAQELYFTRLGELARKHHLNLPRHPDGHDKLAHKPLLRKLLEHVGFVDIEMTQMVTGSRTETPREWTTLMAGLGPLPFTLISVLGPGPREEFEAGLVGSMSELEEDDRFRYHFGFLFAVARKPEAVDEET